MASTGKDTASFFENGTTEQFDYCYKIYPQVLKMKAEKRCKKPQELVRLDEWYQNVLPKLIKERGKDAHLVYDELVQTMKWKQTRGKFYPQLNYLVKVNTPRAVMQETKNAFRKLPNLEQAITALSNLKGVGTTMASALLAAASPDSAPFMADECLMAIPEIEGIDYTTKEYLNFVQHIQTTVERLNKQAGGETPVWSPHTVELALWSHYVANDLCPEMLDEMPVGKGGFAAKANGSSANDNMLSLGSEDTNDRIQTIPEHDSGSEETIPTTIPTIPVSNDPTYEPHYDEMEVDVRGGSELVLPPQTYTPRYNTKNYAMMCDRFGVHDRMGSALATALMEDLGVKDAHDNLVIMDKSKLRREREKWRQDALRKRYDGSNLISFSFDGRKNDALTVEKIDEKLHPRMVKEPHLVVLREPKSQLIGYTKLESETAASKVNKLIEFFQEKQLSLDSLIAICADGEPTNTGVHGGILRLFEKQLKRPLHWFVCLLHFNELPFRDLFDTLDKSTTTGPRSTTGKLSSKIADCENLPVVTDFEEIALENMPPGDLNPEELSTDSRYLMLMANAISNGVVPADLSHIKPGPIAHSRWLTKANRLLRLYVTTNNPTENLKILANYIIKVYTPMYFNVKYYSSAAYGSTLLFKFITWTRFLPPNLLGVVNTVIQDNPYFAHSENILLSMLFDDRMEKRNIAIKKILHYRRDIVDPTELRVYKKSLINFNCTEYTNMIDLNDDTILFEPPFTQSYSYERLEGYLNYEVPPFDDPQIPLHIQGTERHVQLLAATAKRVAGKNVEGAMATTLESRTKTPRLESKQDFQKK